MVRHTAFYLWSRLTQFFFLLFCFFPQSNLLPPSLHLKLAYPSPATAYQFESELSQFKSNGCPPPFCCSSADSSSPFQKN